MSRPSGKSQPSAGNGLPSITESMPVVHIGVEPMPVGFHKGDQPPPPHAAITASGEQNAIPATNGSRANTSSSLGLKRTAHHVSVPTYRDLTNASPRATKNSPRASSSSASNKKRKHPSWRRPKEFISEDTTMMSTSEWSSASGASSAIASGNHTSAYDADEEDENFFQSWLRSNPTSKLKLDDLEQAIEVLERECRYAEMNAEMNRNDQDLQCRNAASLAKADYFLLKLHSKSSFAFQPGTVSFGELEKQAHAAGETAAKVLRSSFTNDRQHQRNNNHHNNKKKYSVEDLVSISVLNQLRNLTNQSAFISAIYRYWISKRNREGGSLINITFLRAQAKDSILDNEPPETVAKVYSRLRELREDLERVRLVADSARKREKLKKELIRLS